MSSKQFLSTLFLLIITTFNSPLSVVAQCPYPCNPPPIAGGSSNMPPPATTLPPPSQTGNYPPPIAVFSPPSNVYPYNPQTPTFYGGAPPSPDPVVPWFPYYYKDPPRNPHKSSAADRLSGSMVVIFLLHVLLSLN
uniref:classical arabinogalactan protein 9-like n=1 Tax=Erigeron canadensis TaxID=72917 RepID=UPI001CB90053|nr:classical arabinogalactan protein 9-like [Erigeron canadensis]